MTSPQKFARTVRLSAWLCVLAVLLASTLQATHGHKLSTTRDLQSSTVIGVVDADRLCVLCAGPALALSSSEAQQAVYDPVVVDRISVSVEDRGSSLSVHSFFIRPPPLAS